MFKFNQGINMTQEPEDIKFDLTELMKVLPFKVSK